MAYIHHTKDRFLDAFIGDPLSERQIWLFADADWAGDEEAKSTSGCTTVIVGPNTYFPINSFSNKQTVISTSSTEAEVVAANQAFRAEGLPVLALFEKLAYGKVATKLAPNMLMKKCSLALTPKSTKFGTAMSILDWMSRTFRV